MVKTRLARTIGKDLAFELSICFIRDLLHTARGVDAEMIIVGTGSTGKGPAGLFGGSLRLLQHGRDLGARMHHAFVDVFARGFGRVALIGSDSPGLPSEYIRRAFHELRTHDIVLGPAKDGGYYLIAFNRESLMQEVFRDVPWGTNRVFTATMGKIDDSILRAFVLPQWEDIDEIDDLARFAEEPELHRCAPRTREFVEMNRERIFGVK